MKASEVVELVATTLEGVPVDGPLIDGADLQVFVGQRKGRLARRHIEITPGIPERIDNEINDCQHDIELEIRYFFPAASGGILSALDDSVTILDALVGLTTNNDISSVSVDSGRVNELSEHELEVFRLCKIRYLRS